MFPRESGLSQSDPCPACSASSGAPVWTALPPSSFHLAASFLLPHGYDWWFAAQGLSRCLGTTHNIQLALPQPSLICLPSPLRLLNWQRDIWNRHSWMALPSRQGKAGLFPWLKCSNQFREKYHMKSKYCRPGQARVFLYNHADKQVLQPCLSPGVSGIACSLQPGDVSSAEVGGGFHLWDVVERRESLGGYKLCSVKKESNIQAWRETNTSFIIVKRTAYTSLKIDLRKHFENVIFLWGKKPYSAWFHLYQVQEQAR